jgi:hypothetical protein
MSNVGSESLHRKIRDSNNYPKIFPSFQKLITAEYPLSHTYGKRRSFVAGF